MGDEKLLFDLGGVASPSPVPLAHTSAFAFGPLQVEPARRLIVAADGRAEMLEPLVLQVLIALVFARGRTLNRDDLILACWDGRIVSDDAINRVISKLRRILTELAGERIQLETVPKVGYRLTEIDPPAKTGEEAAGSGAMPTSTAPQRSRRALAVAASLVLGVSAAAAAAWTMLGSQADDAGVAIGVEPVDSTSATREVRAFASALTGDLSQLAGAISRVSFIDGAGRHNGLDYLVRISVDHEADRLVARARLVSAADGAVLWSNRFEDSSAHPDRLRALVAMQTAGVMRCGLERSAKVLGDATSIRLFFAACDAVKNEDFARGRSFAQQIVARRPDVAAGWACLAMTSLMASWAPGAPPEALEPARAEAKRYARRALALDPQAGRAYQALALTERAGSAAQFATLAKGIAAEPELPALHSIQSGALFSAGYVRASLAPAQRALALDPTSHSAHNALVRRLLATGRTDEGQALYAKAVEVWPDQPSAARERIAMLVGEADPRVALAELERLLPRLARGDRPLPLQRTELRWRTFPASRDPAALDSEAEVEFAASPETAWYIVAAMTRMGESERALAWLARAPREAPRYQWAALFWPDIAPLRRDPQFFQAMAELGFVELWRKRGKWPDFCSEPELRYDCQTEAARLVASSRS